MARASRQLRYETMISLTVSWRDGTIDADACHADGAVEIVEITLVQSSTWLSAAGPVPAAIAPRSHRDPESGGRGWRARLAGYDAKRRPRSARRSSRHGNM